MEPTFKLTTPAAGPVPINPVAEPMDAAPSDISFDDLQALAGPPPVADISFDELAGLAEPETTATGFSLGGATQPVQYPEQPPIQIGLGTELWRHFTGRDIEGKDFEDPNLWMRLTSMIGMGLMGGKAGGAMAAAVQPEFAPVGMAVGGGIGTVAGVFYPETVNTMLARAGFYDGGKAPAGLSPHQLLRYARNELLIGAAIGTTIRGTGMTAQFLTRRLMPINQADQALADAAHEMNIMLTRVQFMDKGKGVGSAIAAAVPAFGVFPLLFGPGRRALDLSAESLGRAAAKMPALAGEPSNIAELSVEAYRKGRNLYHEMDATYAARWADLRREADAKGAGFWVHNTVAEYDRTIANLRKESVRFDGIVEDGIPAPTNGRVIDEVRENIQRFFGALPGVDERGVRYVRQRPYSELHTIRQVIKQDIAKYEGKDHDFAAGIYSKFIEAVNADLLTGGANAAAFEIGEKATTLAREHAQVFTQYFRTSLAKFAWDKVNRGGIEANFDKATKQPVDMLAKFIVKRMNESPQSVEELSRLMVPGSDVMKKFTYHTLREVVEQSQIQNKAGELVLDPGVFRNKLGLGNFESVKNAVVERLLKESNSPITVENLNTLADAAEKVGQVQLGKVSTFLVRTGSLNHVKGMAAAILPGAASYGLTGDFVTGTMLWASSIGLSRTFSAMLTEPVAAKALQTLMSDKVSSAVKVTAFAQVLRQTAAALRNDPEGLGPKTAATWQQAKQQYDDIEMLTEGFIATFTDALKGKK